MSRHAQALDADYRAFVDPNWSMRSFEGIAMAVYEYQSRDGWTVRPNFQYIIHPGGATMPAGQKRSKAHPSSDCERPSSSRTLIP